MILLLLYAILVLFAAFVWKKIPSVSHKRTHSPLVTAIVVVRNEEKNIENLLKSFKEQSYPHLEVILIDDASTDNTRTIAESKSWTKLRVLPLERQGPAPKKEGITLGIAEAQGELIFTTDGDCTFEKDLIETYVRTFEHSDLQFAAGPVTFREDDSLWQAVQTVEFASLIGVAGVALHKKSPLMCSAANLFYRKSAFTSVNGYEGNEHVASGDDEFLMNKIHRRYPDAIAFVKDQRCIVQTEAAPSLAAFYHQRKRWAGKWNKSTNRLSQATAIAIFLVNLFTLYLAISGKWEAVIARFLAEFVFLSAVLLFLRKPKSVIFIPITQCLYSVYVVFFGLISVIPSKYVWKERTLE